LVAQSCDELIRLQEVRDLIEEHIGRLNAELNRWETIKKVVVAERNRELLDSFYR